MRAVAEAFGRPDAVRLEVDGEVIHESGEFGAPGPQHEARVRESVRWLGTWRRGFGARIGDPEAAFGIMADVHVSRLHPSGRVRTQFLGSKS